MARYRATIVSPKGANPTTSVIEYESDSRAGSRQNIQDARYKMLELHGADAIGWSVKDVERISDTKAPQIAEQMQFDFREPTEQKKRRRRSVKRGF